MYGLDIDGVDYLDILLEYRSDDTWLHQGNDWEIFSNHHSVVLANQREVLKNGHRHNGEKDIASVK